ncbi:unnamed protein product, partial [Laminaria digitata]
LNAHGTSQGARMEQLSQLTEDQRIEVNEHYARKFNAEREEAAQQQAREEEEQESRSDAHPTAETVTTLGQASLPGW